MKTLPFMVPESSSPCSQEPELFMNVRIYIYIYVDLYKEVVRMYALACVCMYECVYPYSIHAYMYVCLCMYACIFTCEYMCICTFIHEFIYGSVHACIFAVHMYGCILYSSPNIVRMMKSRRMRWAGHAARL
jgi:hypothetical protein